MPLFGRKRSDVGPAGSAAQPPDEFGEQARLAYGSQQFSEALELYARAIDKLHTMYVMGGCQYRQPSQADEYIVTGFVSALGAAKAISPSADFAGQAEPPIGYLSQIADAASQRGLDPSIYSRAANDASSELRR